MLKKCYSNRLDFSVEMINFDLQCILARLDQNTALN